MPLRPLILSHPTGNANLRQTLLAAEEAGLLREFWTCLSWPAGGAWQKLLPANFRAALGRRSFPEIPAARIRTSPWREAGRLAVPALGAHWLDRHERGLLSVDAVFQALDIRVAQRVQKAPASESGAVYTTEDCAAATLAAARERGWRRFYDLPIGYWRAAHAMYREEAERAPEWAPTMQGLRDSEAKLGRKDRELALAETVVVASSFTARTLELAPAAPRNVQIAAYGAPPVIEQGSALRAPGGRLRVLYVGQLSQRKGLSYLFSALEMLKPQAELTLIGRQTGAACRPLEAALRRHRWLPSLPHARVLEEMVRHDVLVFPSLFEGFGLVLLEAMSRGLPVIATPNCAAPDFLQEGVDGFIVPIRSAEAIAEKLDLLASSPALLSAMQAAARAAAAARPWTAYRRRVAEILQ